ncbi:hypothetical protein V5799_014806, partial [Amblyomma americanum]
MSSDVHYIFHLCRSGKAVKVQLRSESKQRCLCAMNLKPALARHNAIKNVPENDFPFFPIDSH